MIFLDYYYVRAMNTTTALIPTCVMVPTCTKRKEEGSSIRLFHSSVVVVLVLVVVEEESIPPHLILQEVVPMAPMIRHHALSWEEKPSPRKEMDHLDGSMMYAPADDGSNVAALSNPKKEQH